MPLNESEKERVRYHLGYLEVSAASSIQFGIPRPLQTIFLVEQAMVDLLEVAVDRVRNIIDVLDGIECRLVEAQKRLAAKQVDTLHLREDEPDKLEGEYVRWASRLADTLGVPLYPYSQRFKSHFSKGAGNVPVRN